MTRKSPESTTRIAYIITKTSFQQNNNSRKTSLLSKKLSRNMDMVLIKFPNIYALMKEENCADMKDSDRNIIYNDKSFLFFCKQVFSTC